MVKVVVGSLHLAGATREINSSQLVDKLSYKLARGCRLLPDCIGTWIACLVYSLSTAAADIHPLGDEN